MLFYVGFLGALSLATAVVSQNADIGEECTTAADCSSAKGLTVCKSTGQFCAKKACACPDGKRYQSGNCEIDPDVAKIGEPCFDSTEVPNAECVGSPKKVTCKSGFTNMGNVLCKDNTVKIVGEACSGADNCFSYTANVMIPKKTSCHRKICDCDIEELIVGTSCKDRTVGDRCSFSEQCPGNLQCVNSKCGCLVANKRFGENCYEPSEYGSKVAGDTCTASSECGKGMSCDACPLESINKCVAGVDVSPVADDCKGGAFRPGQTSLTVYLGAIIISFVVKFW